MPANKKRFNKFVLLEYLGIMAGVFLMAVSLSFFLIPAQIVAGGVSGIAIILFYLLELPVGIVMLIINIPIFIVALKTLGVSFIFRSIIGILFLSIFIEVLQLFAIMITEDLLLSSIYGGVLMGLGLGLVFRLNGTTGGTDMSARILSYYTDFSTGQALLMIDGLIVGLAGLFFNLEVALYAAIVIFIASRTIDIIQEGPNISKMCFIISEKTEIIKKNIINQLDRGITTLEGRGGYTDQKKQVLLCIINRTEVTRLKRLVHEIDEDAFVIITGVNEVLGEGFKK